MKTIILFLAISITAVFSIQAQEKNEKTKNVQEEVIIKTTTVKGVTEETTETQIIKKEKQVIEINDTGEENQNEIHKTKSEVSKKEIYSSSNVNKENEAAIEEIKIKQQEEIEASKKAQLEKYEAERIEMDKKREEELKKRKDSINNN